MLLLTGVAVGASQAQGLDPDRLKHPDEPLATGNCRREMAINAIIFIAFPAIKTWAYR
jgi:hypothetical protein